MPPWPLASFVWSCPTFFYVSLLSQRDYAIPGEITRDTTIKMAGAKTVVRMVTQKLKGIHKIVKPPAWVDIFVNEKIVFIKDILGIEI